MTVWNIKRWRFFRIPIFKILFKITFLSVGDLILYLSMIEQFPSYVFTFQEYYVFFFIVRFNCQKLSSLTLLVSTLWVSLIVHSIPYHPKRYNILTIEDKLSHYHTKVNHGSWRLKSYKSHQNLILPTCELKSHIS